MNLNQGSVLWGMEALTGGSNCYKLVKSVDDKVRVGEVQRLSKIGKATHCEDI